MLYYVLFYFIMFYFITLYQFYYISYIMQLDWIRLDYLGLDLIGSDYCILHYIIFYCIVLYCIVLYCIVLYCIVLYCIVLYCIIHFYSILHNYVMSCQVILYHVCWCCDNMIWWYCDILIVWYRIIVILLHYDIATFWIMIIWSFDIIYIYIHVYLLWLLRYGRNSPRNTVALVNCSPTNPNKVLPWCQETLVHYSEHDGMGSYEIRHWPHDLRLVW